MSPKDSHNRGHILPRPQYPPDDGDPRFRAGGEPLDPTGQPRRVHVTRDQDLDVEHHRCPATRSTPASPPLAAICRTSRTSTPSICSQLMMPTRAAWSLTGPCSTVSTPLRTMCASCRSANTCADTGPATLISKSVITTTLNQQFRVAPALSQNGPE